MSISKRFAFLTEFNRTHLYEIFALRGQGGFSHIQSSAFSTLGDCEITTSFEALMFEQETTITQDGLNGGRGLI